MEFEDERVFESQKRHIMSCQSLPKVLGYTNFYSGKETRISKLKK